MSRLFSAGPAGALVLLLSSVLAGCGATGKGVRPINIQIGQTAQGLSSIGQPLRVFECVPVQLEAFMFFSDGSIGNFTDRVTWVSSNEAAVRMSNGDVPDPRTPGVFFPRGTAIGTGTGSTTISANFGGAGFQQIGGITNFIGASSEQPTSITFRRVDQAGPVPISSLTVGAGTQQQMSVVAQLGPVEADITASAKLLFLANPADATVLNNLYVVGLGAGGGSQLLTAAFPNCPIIPELPVTVVPVRGIVIQPEFGTSTLIAGTTEEMRTFADLGNGILQDVSLQASYLSNDANTVAFPANTLSIGSNGAPANMVTGLISGGPVNLQSFLRLISNNSGFEFASPEFPVTVVSANLVSFSITPTQATIHQGSDDVLRFHAIGLFDNGLTQDVTRSATWAVATLQGNATPLAAVGNQLNIKGFVTPGEPATSGRLDSGQLEVVAGIGITPPHPARADLFVLSPGQ